MVLAKRIDKQTDVPDRLDRLVEYIADARQEGEKLDQFWIGNCRAGSTKEDMDLAIQEMMATQKKNKRASDNKAYHLIVSFRSGERPEPEELREITDMYLEALGYQEHQYAAGSHANTANYHLHIAVNKVHSKTGRLLTPFRDFHILDKVSRQVEKKYGLQIDNGIEEKREQGKSAENSAARDFEAHRWEQSFLGYCEEHRDAISTAIEESGSWHELNKAMADYDLIFKPRGAGMVIADLDGKHHVRASSVNRVFSKPKLTEKFGPHEQAPEQVIEKDLKPRRETRYQPKPITKHKATGKLWRRWQGIQNSNKDKLLNKQGKPVTSWKEYLLYSLALRDPLAVAIVIHQRQLIHAIIPGAGRSRKSSYKPTFEKSSGPERPVFTALPERQLQRLSPEAQKAHQNILDWHAMRTAANAEWSDIANMEIKPGSLDSAMVRYRETGSWRDDLATEISNDLALNLPLLAQMHVRIEHLRQDHLSALGLTGPDARHQARQDWKEWIVTAPEGKDALKAFDQAIETVKDQQHRQQHKDANQILRENWKQGTWTGWKWPGCKTLKDGEIVLPLRDSKGYLQDLLYLQEGKERLHNGELKAGIYYLMHKQGKLPESGKKKDHPAHMLVVRDYGSAKALHQVSGLPVAVAVGTSNLEPVIKALKKQYPQTTIVMAGEHGKREYLQQAIADRHQVDLIWPSGDRSDAALDATFEYSAQRHGFAVLQERLQNEIGTTFDKPFIRQEEARALWDNAEWASQRNSTWLRDNRLSVKGLKVTVQDDLLVPVRDMKGRLQSLQRIDWEGYRHMLTGDLPEGGHFVVGKDLLTKSKKVLVTEDLETGLKMFREEQMPVAVVFDENNRQKVVKDLSKAYGIDPKQDKDRRVITP